MKTRIIDNYVTSIIGALVLGLSFYLMIKGQLDSIGFASMLALGFTYLRSKDSLIGLDPK
jgi:hypothetical protein